MGQKSSNPGAQGNEIAQSSGSRPATCPMPKIRCPDGMPRIRKYSRNGTGTTNKWPCSTIKFGTSSCPCLSFSCGQHTYLGVHASVRQSDGPCRALRWASHTPSPPRVWIPTSREPRPQKAQRLSREHGFLRMGWGHRHCSEFSALSAQLSFIPAVF
ncbi:uncharacterized protein LY79DRAFT_408424 [Colletotrichum navitas]|uniref:Uncharacterized protein n=1 Tax=Colletotrichum navitas TaxID=681940 RepID=A0AAD8Q7M6_9PEZI|nr:uncharacterized protein LY79DRAFT_408424 [Colletotrichum navitas]KAK1597220.1 hypothetical protein LY79DRAFT_408424 [Colletotrichum navitas]